MTIIKRIFWLIIIGIFGYFGIWQWMFMRINVEPGEMLILKSNMGKPNPDPMNYQVVKWGYKGIIEDVIGEGRHFYNPFLYSRRILRKMVNLGPLQIGLVISKSGKPLPPGEFLAEPGYKGVLREVLTPGKWRLNPVAYNIIPMRATVIRPGYVGCVTSLTKDPEHGYQQQGILPNVLQPGIYYINPKAYRVEEVEIGYRHINLRGVTFKSVDGLNIQLDVSVVWGLKPENVPYLIGTLGNVKDIISKIIKPQVDSTVRNEGARFAARQFIEGKTRETFQNQFTNKLKAVCREKKIEILVGLIRNISIPYSVRNPINQAKIAIEERRMKVEKEKTQVIKNKLAALREDIVKGIRETDAGTKRMIAKLRADGAKKILAIQGEKEVEVAKIMRQVAELEAKIQLVKGRAKAQVVAMLKKAKADQFVQFVKAIGSPKALSHYIFTKKLPKDLKVMMRYSGKGTFWTDLPKTNRWRRASQAKILQSAP